MPRRDDDDRTSRRGFAAMDPEEQREIARMGGRASHGGRGRDYEEEEDGRSRGRSWDEDREDRGNGHSRRGFAAMDPEEQREIARMGGRASHGGRGRDYEEDEDRDSRGRWTSRSESRSGSRYESRSSGRGYDEDDWRSRGRSSRDYDEDRGNGHSRRGFAGMDPEEQREISRMGGRASHGGRGRDYEEDDWRSRGRSSRDYDEDRGNGHSRRGFAAMDPEEQREISRMGGRASHGSRGRDYEEDRDNRSGRSSSWDDQPRDEYGRFTSERR